jgi:hypothetical protein
MLKPGYERLMPTQCHPNVATEPILLPPPEWERLDIMDGRRFRTLRPSSKLKVESCEKLFSGRCTVLGHH